MSNMVDRLERNRKERYARARKVRRQEIKEAGRESCPQCGEELADPLLPCGFCQEEDELDHGPDPVAA